MTEHQSNQPDTPPSGLTLEALAEWWRNRGANMRNVKTLSNYERICPRCHDVQPCTGINECTSCGGTLRGAKRRRVDLFESQ
jgi:DnaJ-class molecular chaperone